MFTNLSNELGHHLATSWESYRILGMAPPWKPLQRCLVGFDTIEARLWAPDSGIPWFKRLDLEHNSTIFTCLILFKCFKYGDLMQFRTIFGVTRSTAFRWPRVFFDASDVVDHVWFVRANRNSCDFSVKAVNALVRSRKMKTVNFAYTKPPFWGFLQSPQLIRSHNSSAICCSQRRFKFFQEPFRIWILQAWSRTTWAHIVSRRGFHSGMSTLRFKTVWAGKKSFNYFQDRSNIWVPGTTLETPGNNLGPSVVKFFTWWTTLCTATVCHSVQHSIYFIIHHHHQQQQHHYHHHHHISSSCLSSSWWSWRCEPDAHFIKNLR